MRRVVSFLSRNDFAQYILGIGLIVLVLIIRFGIDRLIVVPSTPQSPTAKREATGTPSIVHTRTATRTLDSPKSAVQTRTLTPTPRHTFTPILVKAADDTVTPLALKGTVTATPTATATQCPNLGQLIQPGPKDARHTKPGGADAILFQWTGVPNGLPPNLAYRIWLYVYNKRTDTLENFRYYTSKDPQRWLDKTAEVPFLVYTPEDKIVKWWVTVMVVEGQNQDGTLTGPDCGPDSEHTWFPLLWAGP